MNDENPIILFDDFTSAIRWINFDFKVKSSAIKILKAKYNTNLKYCYYYMSTINFDTTEHKRLWISRYSKIKIPIPPLEVQAQIVEKLDHFNDLVHDIEKGLPKEIELRQKQYEYYRDKLLDFK